MSNKEVEFVIKPNGEMSVETFNTKGEECLQIITEAVNYVGGSIGDEHKKDEFFSTPSKVLNRG